MTEWDLSRENVQIQTYAFFLLNDGRETVEFMEMGWEYLPILHEFSDFSSGFAPLLSSMMTMEELSSWILYASIGATLLILSLLITLFLRDRRHEMGVYLALGEKKRNIMVQLLLEVVTIAFLGISLAIFAGHYLSDTISRQMLQTQLAQPVAQDYSVFSSGSFGQLALTIPSLTFDEMMEAFEVSLSGEIVLLFYSVSLGVVILSTLIPVLYVVRLNPKKVLM